MKRGEGVRGIPSRWIFKIKRDEHGNAARYKARLVAKGYVQEYGVDFFQTYAPVLKIVTARLFLNLAAKLDFEVSHVDVKTAFRHWVVCHWTREYLIQVIKSGKWRKAFMG